MIRFLISLYISQHLICVEIQAFKPSLAMFWSDRDQFSPQDDNTVNNVPNNVETDKTIGTFVDDNHYHDDMMMNNNDDDFIEDTFSQNEDLDPAVVNKNFQFNPNEKFSSVFHNLLKAHDMHPEPAVPPTVVGVQKQVMDKSISFESINSINT